MSDLPSFRVSGQSSGICRYAYGPAYGYPTHNIEEARLDAQRMADVLQESVKLLDDNLAVLETFKAKG
jgi:ABC-type sulfate transport system substrate-binding protein